MCSVIDDIGAGVDQSNDSQYGEYGPEGAFQVHDFDRCWFTVNCKNK
jgi:hypothetical protein